MKVKEILADKGSRVVTIDPKALFFDIIAVASANRIGSLMVVDKQEKILGIVAARDILMTVVNRYDDLKTVTADEIMTKDLIVGSPNDDIAYIQTIMTENRIRHVPILEAGKLQGIVSIGDVVKSQLTETNVENKYLKDYIADKYPG
jgi:CBS domain-containing protein